MVVNVAESGFPAGVENIGGEGVAGGGGALQNLIRVEGFCQYMGKHGGIKRCS